MWHIDTVVAWSICLCAGHGYWTCHRKTNSWTVKLADKL